MKYNEAAVQILNGVPGKFYIFAGTEYGIKELLLEKLEQHYGSKIEYTSVDALVKFFQVKRIVPQPPSLYVVRYDSAFVKSANASTAKMIHDLNIVGTVVLIYEKEAERLAKLLDDYFIYIDNIDNVKVLTTRITADFPQLTKRVVQAVVNTAKNYAQARKFCQSLILIPEKQLEKLSEKEIVTTLGAVDVYTEEAVKMCVAAKNSVGLILVIENYDDNVETIYYAILSALLEIETEKCKKYSNSKIKQYLPLWDVPSIYWMFMHTYEVLRRTRKISIADNKDQLIYLASLLAYKTIPELKEMM